MDVVYFWSAVVTAASGLMVLGLFVLADFYIFDWRKHNGKND